MQTMNLQVAAKPDAPKLSWIKKEYNIKMS